MLTPRENFLRLHRNESVEWIPSLLDTRTFAPSIIPENIVRGMVLEQTPFPAENYGGTGWFGVEWYYDPAAKGSMEKNRLLSEISEWEDKIVFPNLDAYDWEGCARANAEYLNTDKLLCTTIYTGYFERLISFMDYADAAVALVDEDDQEDVHRLFDRLTDFYIDFAQRMHRHFGIDRITVHDDWGTQRSPAISPEVHKEMIMPYIKRLVDAVHAEGMIYEQHSCGMIEPMVPALIDAGVDTWCGQSSANDIDKLIEQYGDRLIFGVIAHPLKSTDEAGARTEIASFLRKYKDRRVWIFVIPDFYTPEQTELFRQLNQPGAL